MGTWTCRVSSVSPGTIRAERRHVSAARMTAYSAETAAALGMSSNNKNNTDQEPANDSSCSWLLHQRRPTMHESVRSAKSPYARHTLLYSAILLATFPVLSLAQGSSAAEEEVEEVVVTGTYIRNSAFAGASPVDTIDQEALLSTGSVSTAQFMRDLVYTDNVDAV